MAETKLEDILIPLLTKFGIYSDEERFNKKFKKIRTEDTKLYLEEKFGFSINFINIITTEELNEIIKYLESHKNFSRYEKPSQYKDADQQSLYARFKALIQSRQYNNFDSLDDLFLDDGADLYLERKIFKSKYPSIKLQNKKNFEKILCNSFVNIAEMKSKKGKNLPYHIISVIPTSYNLTEIDGNELYNLSNEQIIEIINTNISEYLEIDKKFSLKFEKGTFVAIQLWNHHWKDKQDNLFDARRFVRKNPYYFYSILTLEKDIFRRTYENIMDVLGWCQSDSSVYFDVSHGTTCLELTTKPRIDHVNGKYNNKFFDEIGHDSEQFRIWEFLALQHKLLIEIKKNNLNKVDDLINELDICYNFNIFTKKDGKREKWIWYVKYLQRISGIDSDYQDYKNRIEIKNKEHEKKLQHLNRLIIVSILASFLTLLLSPIYDSLVSTYNNPTINSTINPIINSTNNLYFAYILKNPNPESIAIIIALSLTLLSYVYIHLQPMPKITSGIKQYIIIVKHLELSKYLTYIIILLIILAILFIIY
ncbi:MAG: hypothetical protein K8R53_01170 [Bacteroidales bacterium]|nr:hypothetical protein [Bacteroidales bacterium]